MGHRPLTPKFLTDFACGCLVPAVQTRQHVEFGVRESGVGHAAAILNRQQSNFNQNLDVCLNTSPRPTGGLQSSQQLLKSLQLVSID